MKNFKEFITEKSVPNDPKLWSRAKALTKQKFDVYPSVTQTDGQQNGISPRVVLGGQGETIQRVFRRPTKVVR